jgi:hypothetical protein
MHISSKLNYNFDQLRVAVEHFLVHLLMEGFLYIVTRIADPSSCHDTTICLLIVNLCLNLSVVFNLNSGLNFFHERLHGNFFPFLQPFMLLGDAYLFF